MKTVVRAMKTVVVEIRFDSLEKTLRIRAIFLYPPFVFPNIQLTGSSGFSKCKNMEDKITKCHAISTSPADCSLVC